MDTTHTPRSSVTAPPRGGRGPGGEQRGQPVGDLAQVEAADPVAGARRRRPYGLDDGPAQRGGVAGRGEAGVAAAVGEVLDRLDGEGGDGGPEGQGLEHGAGRALGQRAEGEHVGRRHQRPGVVPEPEQVHGAGHAVALDGGPHGGLGGAGRPDEGEPRAR